MLPDNIILTGFMGTGKTTIGRLLAKRLKYDFVDTDKHISQITGKSIAQIFAEQGEAAFRKLETQAAKELATQHHQVIATGGGLILNPENVRILSQSGKILCLSASRATLLERLSSSKTQRPLLAQADLEKKVDALMAERLSHYQAFPQISTDELEPGQIVTGILALLD